MFMVRSFALGLLGACLVVIAMRPAVEVRVSMPAPARQHALAPRAQPRVPSATVIDAASVATPSDLVALLRLRGDEWIAAVDDQRTDPRAAIAEVASAAGAKGRYVDLTIASPRAERRVVLMIH